MALAEFAHNKSTILAPGWPPFEALYNKPCKSPSCWLESGGIVMFTHDMVCETTKVIEIAEDEGCSRHAE